MRSVFIFISLLLLSHITSVAQHSLSGYVTDLGGHALQSATVYVPELQIGTITGHDGSFQLLRLPDKELMVQVSYVGYGTQSRRILISGNTRSDFHLSEAVLETGEVVISGMNAAEEKRLNPLPMEIIKSDNLFRTPGNNLVRSLTEVPGVSAIQTGPAIVKPVIRGLSYNRVLVINEGIRQEGQQWGDEHGLEADPFSINRVELIKGPASLIYGSDGMGGVISITSEAPADEDKLNADLNAIYQTNNHGQGYSAAIAANKNGWTGSFRGSYLRAGDYQNKRDGFVFNSGSDEYAFDGKAGVNRRWGYVHLHANSFNQKVGLIVGERDSTGQFLDNEKPYQRIQHLRLSLNHLIFIGQSALRITLGIQENKRREFEGTDPPELFMDLMTINYDFRYHLKEMKGWQPIFGMNGMAQSHQNRADEALIPDYSLIDLGMFAYAKKQFDRWHFNAGVRFDLRSGETSKFAGKGVFDKFEDSKFNFRDLSASTGITFSPTEAFAIKANLSRGFRYPNLAELASDGIHEGTYRYESGNKDLRPENNIELDLGADFEKSHYSVSFNIFYNHFNSFIHLQKLLSTSGTDSLVFIEGHSYPAFTYVQADSRLYGGEAMLDLHPHPLDWLHIEQSLAVVFGDQLEGGRRYLPLIPAPVYRGELKVEFRRSGKWFRNSYASLEFQYRFPQERVDTDSGFETPTPDYWLVSASLGSEIVDRKGKKIMKWAIIGENLADIAYQDHLSRLKYAPENIVTGERGIYEVGRNITFRLAIPLEFSL